MSTDDDDDKTPIDQLVDQAADLFVYAPIGLFFEGPSLLPKLAEQGRVHARNARMFGQFAVRHGEAEVRRRLDGIEQQATGIMRLVGLLPDEPADEPVVASRAPTVPVDEPPSGDGYEPPGPDVAELAIPDYDSLSASQVVTRLEGLTPVELESVRAYETANRGRKTILNKAAQLQA